MMHELVTPPVAVEEARERSLSEDLRDLADHARTFAQAELSYQKTRAAYAGQEAKSITVYAVLAAVFLFFAAMGLVFGLILALTPILTAWGATAVVCIVLLGVAALCGWLSLRRFRHLTAALSGHEEQA